jgi:hypothetical protein
MAEYYLEGYTLEELPGIDCRASQRPQGSWEPNQYNGATFHRDYLPSVEAIVGRKLTPDNGFIGIQPLVVSCQFHGTGWEGFRSNRIRVALDLWGPRYGVFHVYRGDNTEVGKHRTWTVIMEADLSYVDRRMGRDHEVYGRIYLPGDPESHQAYVGEEVTIWDDYNDRKLVLAKIDRDHRTLYMFSNAERVDFWSFILSRLGGTSTIRAVDESAAYIKLRTVGLTNQIRQLEEQSRGYRNNIESYRQQLTQQLIGLDEVERDLASRTVPDGRDEQLKEEFQAIKDLEHVKGVEVRGNAITVRTDTVFVDCLEKKWELGDYRITIGTNGSIRIVNERSRELIKDRGSTIYDRDIQHPHVFDGGQACFGNFQEPIAKLVAAGDFPNAFMVIIRFLHSVYVKDMAGFTGDKRFGQYAQYLESHWRPVGEGEAVAEDCEQPEEEVVHFVDDFCAHCGHPFNDTDHRNSGYNCLGGCGRPFAAGCYRCTLAEAATIAGDLTITYTTGETPGYEATEMVEG